jgi:hypothetical protein
MDRKRAPKPRPGPDGEIRDEGGRVRADMRQKPHDYPENEGLVEQKTRKLGEAAEGLQGKALEEAEQAAQRGRSA